MGFKVFSYLDFNVKLVPSEKLLDYAAMNFHAAKAFGFPALTSESDIWLDYELSEEKKDRALKHEVIEFSLMKYEDYAYWPAHKIATAFETYDHNWVASFYNKKKSIKNPLDMFCFANTCYKL